MRQRSSINWLTKLYVYILTIYLFCSYDVTWFYSIPTMGIWTAVIFLSVLKIGFIKSVKSKDLSIIILILIFYLHFTILSNNSVFEVFRYGALSFSMISIVLLPVYEKEYLLKIITLFFEVILVISIPFWLLFLLGVNLPHSALIQHPNGFHVYYNYYFFRIGVQNLDAIFPRFSSVFLEPGQLATPCVFLFFLNAMENEKVFSFKNLVLLVAILLSLSLVGYGILLVSLVAIAWFKGSRYRYILTTFVLLAVGGFYIYFSTQEDSAVNNRILSRLEYDEDKIISGNNRTAKVFEKNYESFIQSRDKYFGIHGQLKTYGYDWTNNSSGYQKFIVHYGIVGFSIFMLLILLLFWHNRNSRTFVFLIILIIASLVRNLLQNPMWLSMAIIGMYTLNNVLIRKHIQSLYQH